MVAALPAKPLFCMSFGSKASDVLSEPNDMQNKCFEACWILMVVAMPTKPLFYNGLGAIIVLR